MPFFLFFCGRMFVLLCTRTWGGGESSAFDHDGGNLAIQEVLILYRMTERIVILLLKKPV